MALFNACICRFDKEFRLFRHYVSQASINLQIKTKTLNEIYDYYRSWKQTKYYKTWKIKSKERAKAAAISINQCVSDA